MAPWKRNAAQYLQKSAYRKKLIQLNRRLTKIYQQQPEEPGILLQELISMLLQIASTHIPFSEPMAATLAAFVEADTVVQEWVRAVKGHTLRYADDRTAVQDYQALKKQLSAEERKNYLNAEFLRADPYIQLLLELQRIIKAVVTPAAFHELRKSYKQRRREFQLLHSWVLEAVVQRNETALANGRKSEDPGYQVLYQRLTEQLGYARQELANIPSSQRAWYHFRRTKDAYNPSSAQQLLDAIMRRWKKLYATDNGYRAALGVLERQYDYLVPFLYDVRVPISTQRLETDHGELKRIWRLSSGRHEQPYTLIYHGNSASMARNLINFGGKPSPLENLGFPQAVLQSWFYTYRYEQVEAVRAELEKLRVARRKILKARRESLRDCFKGSHTIWRKWACRKLQAHLKNNTV